MVSVIIASFNRFNRLVDCVKYVSASDPLPDGGIEMIVVTSTYSLQERESLAGLGCSLVALPRQVLVSAAHNAGAARARGDLLLFLDDDNTVAIEAIYLMATALNTWDEAVLVGPVMYYGDAPDKIWCAGVSRTPILMRTTLRTELPSPTPDRIQSEDFPNCFMCRRSDFDRVNGFDENSYPMHMAESDFARRLVASSGRRVYCVARARVWHHIAPSFGRRVHLMYRSELASADNAKRAYWIGRSRALFAAEYGSTIQFLLFTLLGQWLIAFIYVSALLLGPRRGRLGQIRAYVAGVFSGIGAGIGLRLKDAHAGAS
jgi:GT2 family glycosyltransferase